MRGRNVEIQQADLLAARLIAAIGGSRVDCMTPQKAIRMDLFNWSSAAIVSPSVGAASCITNPLSAARLRWSEG
jgi:hypothetical protein